MKRRRRKKQVGRICRDMRRGDRWWAGWHLRWQHEAAPHESLAIWLTDLQRRQSDPHEKGNGT